MLANLYLSERESIRVVQQAGLDPICLDFAGSAVTRWFSILRYWQTPTDTATLEKIMGSEPAFLPIAFLEIGTLKAKAVGKIVCAGGSGSDF